MWSFHPIVTFFLVMGLTALIIGVADIAVTIVLRRARRVPNILIGVAFVLIGSLMIYLAQQRTASYHIDLGPAMNDLSGWLVLVLGVGAFVLAAVLSIREGHTRLKARNLSRFTIWRSRFQIVSGVIFIVLILLGVVLLLYPRVR